MNILSAWINGVEYIRKDSIKEEKRKAAIERAMLKMERAELKMERAELEMERAELEAAKESKKPELGKHRKFFFIRTQISLSCEPNATREDAENTLEQIISENHGEVLRIDSVIEE